MGGVPWNRVELTLLVLYALGFYLVVIWRSLRLSHGTSVAPSSSHLLMLSPQRLPLVSQLLHGCRIFREALRTTRGITCGSSECACHFTSFSLVFYLKTEGLPV
jgi:hypothetical protein